nr:MAG TPA: hypothetical protein [Caudoviricetes sp.]
MFVATNGGVENRCEEKRLKTRRNRKGLHAPRPHGR